MKGGSRVKKVRNTLFCITMTLILAVSVQNTTASASSQSNGAEVALQYAVFLERVEGIERIEDIEANGFDIVTRHVFDINLQVPKLLSRGDEQNALPQKPQIAEPIQLPTEETAREEPEETVVRPVQYDRIDPQDLIAVSNNPVVRFFVAIDRTTHRVVVFLADANGKIVYRNEQLECNYVYRGEVNQPVRDMVSVAFRDVNGDNLTDIILIAGCENESGDYKGKTYKVGEVLFQTANQDKDDKLNIEEVNFYRDWRINDKLNRFDMNKSAECIITFVRDGKSTEFLYTASTEQELLDHGFRVVAEQSYMRTYEKLGKLKVLPGFFTISDYDIFMIYMVNEQGDIVWSFQPMGDFDNLYSLKGMSARDLDGDGMKDLAVLAKYSREDETGHQIVETRCSVYYQRTGGFVADTGFVENYVCTGEETMEEMVNAIRAYWEWNIDDKNTDRG